MNFPISQNPILRCKLRTIHSFCTQNVSLYWFGVKFLWWKDFFPWYSDFLNFGELVNYTKYREQQWRGWHFVCICIPWTLIFASLWGKSWSFYWCQVFAVSFWFLSKNGVLPYFARFFTITKQISRKCHKILF